jgi:hypothetical protein
MKHYRGILNSLPEAGCRGFRISIAFLFPLGKEFEKFKDLIQFADPDLQVFFKLLDFKNAGISFYIGDPDEELEKYLKKNSNTLRKQNLDYMGFLVVGRAAKLGQNDDLPQTQEEWDAKIQPLEMTEDMQKFFDHLKKHYLQTDAPISL